MCEKKRKWDTTLYRILALNFLFSQFSMMSIYYIYSQVTYLFNGTLVKTTIRREQLQHLSILFHDSMKVKFIISACHIMEPNLENTFIIYPFVY